MFGFSKDSSQGKRKKKRSNLEFDFITGPSSTSRSAPIKKIPSPVAEPAPEKKFEPEPAPEPVTPKNDKPDFTNIDSEPVQETQSPKEEQPRMTSPFSEPTPIRSTESIRRQKKEQSTVNNMLNGVVIAIICAILLVATLAGTGAWVMWKQINNQSATIALLESKTNSRFEEVQQSLADENKKLSDALALTNQQMLDLNRQVADSQKIIAAMRQTQALMQKRIDSQDATIATIRTRQTIR